MNFSQLYHFVTSPMANFSTFKIQRCPTLSEDDELPLINIESSFLSRLMKSTRKLYISGIENFENINPEDQIEEDDEQIDNLKVETLEVYQCNFYLSKRRMILNIERVLWLHTLKEIAIRECCLWQNLFLYLPTTLDRLIIDRVDFSSSRSDEDFLFDIFSECSKQENLKELILVADGDLRGKLDKALKYLNINMERGTQANIGKIVLKFSTSILKLKKLNKLGPIPFIEKIEIHCQSIDSTEDIDPHLKELYDLIPLTL
ncbi:hypothetical protein FGO68_gene406 [Halteria grandinella]|uniref:Uncharacterized protein n=1 Tax=Halteria grandinella TaxID=5974 RepID=A0A8J8T0Z9_HALGN|nr:hypothetical protein FGO68_gene406 [Halteria grandinella]